MSTLETYQESFAFNRSRTLALLDSIAEMESPAAVLGWRPGEGRAHIAWQLMHIGVTEELFGVERLASRPEAARHADIWERFRGGSTPDDTIPSVDEIRQVLSDGRELMSETLASADAEGAQLAHDAPDCRVARGSSPGTGPHYAQSIPRESGLSLESTPRG